MKKFLMYITVAASLVACNNDLETEGVSRTTYFPEFVMEGSDFIIVDDAAAYSEPGIEVLEQGSPIDFTTTYTGRYSGYSGTTIGTDDDEYTVTYAAVNRDGFAAAATRTVVVTGTGDFETSIEGLYSAETVRISGEAYDENIFVMVTEVSPGVFAVTDALGGFYSDGRALGDDYLVLGLEIAVNDLATNDFTYTSDVERADGIAMEVSELSIDPETRTISFHTSAPSLASGDWDITLTQIQPE